MNIAHFYHCWCGGLSEPYEEHAEALERAEFAGELIVSLIGTPEQRKPVRDLFRSRCPQSSFLETDQGHEYLTFRAAREYARNRDGAILYMHTHGAWHPSPAHVVRRQAAIDALVLRWREALRRLESEDDTAVLTVGDSYWFTLARCASWWRTEQMSEMRISAVAKSCIWSEDLAARAAPDIFLLSQLEREIEMRKGLNLGRHPESIALQGEDRVSALPEHACASAVAATNASWPRWNLAGNAKQPVMERLDLHFTAPQIRYRQFVGAGPCGRMIDISQGTAANDQ